MATTKGVALNKDKHLQIYSLGVILQLKATYEGHW